MTGIATNVSSIGTLANLYTSETGSLVGAINENYQRNRSTDDLANDAYIQSYSNASSISTNSTGIATNVTGIATNASGISTNTSAITANDTDIAANTSSISTNTSGISTNSTGIATNSSSISMINDRTLANFSSGARVFDEPRSKNVSVGTLSALNLTSGRNNTAIGNESLKENTTGNSNTAVGYKSMNANVKGNFNSAFGINSLRSNTSGNSNSAFGFNSLLSNISGTNNSGFGSKSLFKNSVGINNAAYGAFSLYKNTSGSFNTALGYKALYGNESGSSNIAIGNQSGYGNKGSGNIFIGDNSCRALINASNTLCIGGTNPLISGNFSTQRLLIDATVVVTGDLYVSGKIYEGEDVGDDGFDSVGEIASGANPQDLKVNSDNEEVKVSSSSSDSQDSEIINEGDVSDSNSSDNNDINDGNDSEISDEAAIADSSSNSSRSQFNTSSDYAELDQFLALSNEVKELGNRIDMVSLELKETQQYMREGFAMSSALAAMPTPTNYGLNFSAGAGNYDGSNALAFGFVYVRENYVINVGHAKSDTGGKTMTNVGFTYNISSWFKK